MSATTTTTTTTGYLTRENVLALVRSMGEELKTLASPEYYRHEDRGRARGYEPGLQACQAAYRRLLHGEDPASVLRDMRVPDCCRPRLVLAALRGEFETTLELLSKGRPTCGPRSDWFTLDGDLYLVDFGDALNPPCVERVANRRLPKGSDGIDVTGARHIADALPNPCTRIESGAQVC